MIRNLGIIAHIDAGKTTLSERILFYTRKIHQMGEVHSGTATLDYLPEEQERGITITSACTSSTWKTATLNLIDTPGHVDFTIEVERSLRVLDGAIGVFCAVGGVEPQSETVWLQSEHFQVPKLAFINKLDRPGANFQHVFQELQNRLRANPIPLTIPLGTDEEFRGIIDLLTLEEVLFSETDLGQTMTRQPLTQPKLAAPWRELLLERLAETDDIFLEKYLQGEYTLEDINAALRRSTLARQVTPVFCGSALRNIGVQPLLDAIIAYLPGPTDVLPLQALDLEGNSFPVIPDPKSPYLALVFKILMDQGRKLCLTRIYAGTLKEGDVIHNASQNLDERVLRIFRLHADRKEQIPEAQAGDIVAIIGLRSAKTGDTLGQLLLERIQDYAPVISLALEPRNADEGKILDEALTRFTTEDPTLTASLDEGSGHRILSGMGELHLDVILERIQREYSIKPRSGQPQVIKRETPTKSSTATANFDRELGKEYHLGEISISLTPLERGQGNHIEFAFDPKSLSQPMQQAALDGITNALQSGPLTGYPIQDLKVQIIAMPRQDKSTAIGFHMAAGLATRNALEEANLASLEPLMFVEINTPEAHLGSSLSLFGARNGKVENIIDRQGVKIVQGLAPLSKLFGFSTDLRSATQGRAGLMMRFERFDLG